LALAELTAPPSASAEFGLNSPTVRSDAFAEPEETDPVEGETDLQADPNDYSVAADGTVEVQAAETLGHYAEWLDVRASRLRALNHMRYGSPLAIGDRLQLDFARVSPKTFEARRAEHHRTLQGDFFSRYEITGTRTHVVRRGDSIWLLAETRYDVPLWLVRQYNPDLDLGDLRAGEKLAIPELRPR
jgi:membrane-bound lytic murein transglycosylase D